MADDDAQAAAALAAAIVAALPPPNPSPSLASALATINVKTHIPFALKLDPPNYSTRRELFLTLLVNLVCYPISMAQQHPKISMSHGWRLIAQSALSSIRRCHPV